MTHIEVILILEVAAQVTQALFLVAIFFTLRQLARKRNG